MKFKEWKGIEIRQAITNNSRSSATNSVDPNKIEDSSNIKILRRK